jgi:hypothetical protein
MLQFITTFTLCLLFTINGHGQCTVLSLTDLEKIDQSEFIAEGEVVDRHSYFNPEGTLIYTAYQIATDILWKGQYSDSFTVIAEGGMVGLEKHVATPGIDLQVGEKGLFLLRRNELPAYADGARTHAYMPNQRAGSWLPATAFSETGARQTVPSSMIETLQQAGLTPRYTDRSKHQSDAAQLRVSASISSISPTIARAGSGDVLSIRGTGFENTRGTGLVAFRNADSGGADFIAVPAGDYISWSDTIIQVRIPDNAGTGTMGVITNSGHAVLSLQSLTIEWAIINAVSSAVFGIERSYLVNLRGVNSEGGQTWVLNENFAANSEAVSSFTRAFESWRCHSFVNWEIANSSTTVNAPANDGINIVSFDNGSPLGSGTLGVCFSYFSGCLAGSTIRWFITGQDILFNSNFNWNFSAGSPAPGQFDFESVALHELGHAHLHGHVINPSAVMHFSIGPTQVGRTLSSNDLDGADFVLELSSTSVCGQNAFNSLPAGLCNILPVELASISGSCADGMPSLKWQTLSEFNNRFFVVEYSVNALQWTPMDTIQGGGFSDQPLEYQWMSKQLSAEDRWFLRVKQEDFDGSYSFSPIVEVENCSTPSNPRVFPNPFQNTLQVDRLPLDGQTDAFLFNTTGQLVKTWSPLMETQLSTGDLPGGQYLFMLKGRRDASQQEFRLFKL